MKVRILVLAAIATLVGAASALAGTVYTNIPGPLPQNVVSVGFEATQTDELGALVTLGGASGPAPVVTVLMSSWGCETGRWNDGTCVTTPGSTFSVPITLNVYSRGAANAVGTLLATQTKTFAIPFRPSKSASCAATAVPTGWSADGGVTCTNGLATPIHFDPLSITLPTDAIITVAYNTTHYGASPVGESAACYTGPAGCGYDSLNVGVRNDLAVGAQPIPNDAYLRSPAGADYCDSGAGGTGTLRLDAGCWSPYQPNICVETVLGSCARVLSPYVAPKPRFTVSLRAPSRVSQGSSFAYTLRVTNTSTVTATNVVARMTIPKGVSLVRLPAGARLQNGVLVWNPKTLAPGSTFVLRVWARVDRTTTTAKVATARVTGTNAVAAARASTTIRIRLAGAGGDPVVTG